MCFSRQSGNIFRPLDDPYGALGIAMGKAAGVGPVYMVVEEMERLAPGGEESLQKAIIVGGQDPLAAFLLPPRFPQQTRQFHQEIINQAWHDVLVFENLLRGSP